MGKFLIGLYFFVSICCIAPFCYSYPTADEAASAALHQIMPVSAERQVEYGGAIYEQDGEYLFTEPQSSNNTREVTIHIRLPKSAKFVALYHSHPGLEADSEEFSEMDIEVATKLNVPSYIGVTRSNTIHRFIPHQDHIVPVFVRGQAQKSSGGTII